MQLFVTQNKQLFSKTVLCKHVNSLRDNEAPSAYFHPITQPAGGAAVSSVITVFKSQVSLWLETLPSCHEVPSLELLLNLASAILTLARHLPFRIWLCFCPDPALPIWDANICGRPYSWTSRIPPRRSCSACDRRTPSPLTWAPPCVRRCGSGCTRFAP